jgi:hypothetical protein
VFTLFSTWVLWVVVFPLILGVAWFLIIGIVLGIGALVEWRRLRKARKEAEDAAARAKIKADPRLWCFYTGPHKETKSLGDLTTEELKSHWDEQVRRGNKVVINLRKSGESDEEIRSVVQDAWDSRVKKVQS